MYSQGSIGVFETLGLDFVSHNYQWSGTQIGLLVSICGIFGVIILLCFKQLLQITTNMNLVMYGLALMTVSCLLLMNFNGGTVPLGCYYASTVMMYAIGYPIGWTAVIAMYSRIVKSGPQGALQGYLVASGALARVVMPLFAGVVGQYSSDNICFLAVGIMLLVATVVYVLTKNTLISLPIIRE